METYDVKMNISHFYRHEPTLETIYRNAIREGVAPARFRWINYFHVADSVEFRIQTDCDESTLRTFLATYFSSRPEYKRLSITNSK